MSETDLPERARRWCVSSVRHGLRVLRVERLYGGQSAETHLITLELVTSEKRELVLRRFLRDWNPIEREVETLRALEHYHAAQLAVPRLVAFDVTGESCDAPAVLATRVPGCINNAVAGAEARARQLGAGLAMLHSAALQCPHNAPKFELAFENEPKPAPSGLTLANWPRAFAALRAFHAEALARDELIHGDFHIGNALFEAGNLSGVVDWSDVKRGPPEFDVGYCRLDLALLFGQAEADAFSATYQNERRQTVKNLPLWDLAGAACAYPDPAIWLPGWAAAGRSDLTAGLLQKRLQTFVERALSAL